jgi:hypothetical protein
MNPGGALLLQGKEEKKRKALLQCRVGKSRRELHKLKKLQDQGKAGRELKVQSKTVQSKTMRMREKVQRRRIRICQRFLCKTWIRTASQSGQARSKRYFELDCEGTLPALETKDIQWLL